MVFITMVRISIQLPKSQPCKISGRNIQIFYWEGYPGWHFVPWRIPTEANDGVYHDGPDIFTATYLFHINKIISFLNLPIDESEAFAKTLLKKLGACPWLRAGRMPPPSIKRDNPRPTR